MPHPTRALLAAGLVSAPIEMLYTPGAVLLGLVLLARRAWPVTPEPGRRVIRSAGIVGACYLGLVGASRERVNKAIAMFTRLGWIETSAGVWSPLARIRSRKASWATATLWLPDLP